MRWIATYTESARRDLLRIERKTARNIVLKIRAYAMHGNPLRFAKKLKPPFDELYRFRIGEYRAIFEVDKRREIKVLLILRIKHRRDVYE